MISSRMSHLYDDDLLEDVQIDAVPFDIDEDFNGIIFLFDFLD